MSDIVTLNGYKIKDEKAVRSYETVALMKADTKLKEGYHVKTKGYYEANDGGHGEYIIVDDDTLVDDGGLIHVLSNGLRAKLIESNYVNIKQFGAYGDGEHDDLSYIQNAINKNPLKTIYFPFGTYAISNKIVIKNANLKGVNLKLDENTIIKNYSNQTIETLLDIGNDTSDGQYRRTSTSYKMTLIEGGIFDCTNVEKGIISNSDRQFVYFKNIKMINITTTGIYLKRGTYTSGDSKIIDSSFYSPDSTSGIAIHVESHDNVLENIKIDGCKKAVVIDGSSTILNNVHPVALYTQEMTTQQKIDTICFEINNGNPEFSQCYADTYATGFKINFGTGVSLVNCTSYYYDAFSNGEQTQAVWINTSEDINLRITNSYFSSPDNSNVPHKFFRFKNIYSYLLSIDLENITLLGNRYRNHNNVSYNDIAYCVQSNNRKGITPYYHGKTFEADKYYYLGTFANRSQHFLNQFRITNSNYFDVTIQVEDDNTLTTISSLNKVPRTWTFAIVQDETITADDNTSVTLHKLYVKVSSDLSQGVHTSIEPLTYMAPFFSYKKLIPVGETIDPSDIISSVTITQS